MARCLHAFRSDGEIIELRTAATIGEPVKPGEIERAARRSKATAWRPGEPSQTPLQPAWPKLDLKKRTAVIAAAEAGLTDFWEISPYRLEDNSPHCEEIIDLLFPGNPLLCAGLSTSDFATQSREQWRGKLPALAVIVSNPMTARVGQTHERKVSAHTLETTGERRFLVVEYSGTTDDHAALLMHLATIAPLSVVVHSGGKSFG